MHQHLGEVLLLGLTFFLKNTRGSQTSDTGTKGVFDEPGPERLESRPTISLFELWVHLPKLAIGRNYSFPRSLVVPCKWTLAPRALSLSDAVQSVSQHEEEGTRGQPSHITLEAGFRFPNQPVRKPIPF